jgi:hypothetical protein
MLLPVGHSRKDGEMTVEALVANRRLFRAALVPPFAIKILAVAILAVLCGACTEASADCRDEVAAAFERLRTSGRPYRKEVTWVISDQQTFHGTVEFLPPDRMREITTNGVPGYGASETIRVGQWAWSGARVLPWTWHEWDPGSMQIVLEKSKDFSTLSDHPIAAETVFECLGRVAYKGTTYLGYRARLDKAIVSVFIPNTASSEAQQQALARRLEQMPRNGGPFSSTRSACSRCTTLWPRRTNSIVRETRYSTATRTASG